MSLFRKERHWENEQYMTSLHRKRSFYNKWKPEALELGRDPCTRMVDVQKCREEDWYNPVHSSLSPSSVWLWFLSAFHNMLCGSYIINSFTYGEMETKEENDFSRLMQGVSVKIIFKSLTFRGRHSHMKIQVCKVNVSQASSSISMKTK